MGISWYAVERLKIELNTEYLGYTMLIGGAIDDIAVLEIATSHG